MLPHQIYCDYLEDRGINTVLLRTLESEGISVTNFFDGLNCDGFGDGTYDNSSGSGLGCGKSDNICYGFENGNGVGNAFQNYYGGGYGDGTYYGDGGGDGYYYAHRTL